MGSVTGTACNMPAPASGADGCGTHFQKEVGLRPHRDNKRKAEQNFNFLKPAFQQQAGGKGSGCL